MAEDKSKRNEKEHKSVNQYHYDYSGSRKLYQDGRGRTEHRTIVRLVKALDVIAVSIPFYVAWMAYYADMVYQKGFYRRGNWAVMGLFTVLYYLLAHLYSGFTI